MNLLHKLGLGTAQWGMRYGIANRTGRPDAQQVSALLSTARNAGISLLDTAHSYGNAERILGEFRACSNGFRVFTKTPQIRTEAIASENVAAVRTAFYQSLERLKCDFLSGLLVHFADDLLAPGGELLWESIESLKKERLIGQIGVSVYHPHQAIKLLDRFGVDVLQLPFNIYDQRFRQDGTLALLKRAGVEVHARSAFLQGVLLLSPEQLPAHFKPIREHHAQLYRFLSDSGKTPLGSALLFCLLQTQIDRVIVGCETPQQLEEIINAVDDDSGDVLDSVSAFALSDQRILDPTCWNLEANGN